MCTVTYLSLGGSDFILTSSRDENPDRKTSVRAEQLQAGLHTVLCPRDRQAGGTWIAASERASLCLLNGAYAAHEPKPSYRHSRGLILLDYFGFASTDDFIQNYPFAGLEAFTLIIRDEGGLRELRWDEASLFTRQPDPDRPHLWASASLYGPDAVKKRKTWLTEWLAGHRRYDVEAIRQFHKTAGEGDLRNDLLMRRENVQTVSLTSIVKEKSTLHMWYEPLGKSVLNLV